MIAGIKIRTRAQFNPSAGGRNSLKLEKLKLFGRQLVLETLVLLADEFNLVGIFASRHIQSQRDIVSRSKLIDEPADI